MSGNTVIKSFDLLEKYDDVILKNVKTVIKVKKQMVRKTIWCFD